MRTISKLILTVFIFILLLLLSGLYGIPKAVIIDRLLMERGIYLLAGKVRETPLSIELEKARIFLRDEELGRFEKLKLSLRPFALNITGKCRKGVFSSTLSAGGDLEIKLRNLDCVKRVQSASGKLKIEGDKIFGNIEVKGLKVPGASIDSANFEFKGQDFKGKITYLGMTLTGGGKVKINPKNLRESTIDARFQGKLGNLVVRGTLGNISVRAR